MAHPSGKPSALLDTRVVYCGDNLEQLQKLPGGCVDLIYIDPPFNSNRNYEVFWGETKQKRSFEDRHASTAAYIDYMRPRCVELGRKNYGGGKYRQGKAQQLWLPFTLVENATPRNGDTKRITYRYCKRKTKNPSHLPA